VLCWSRLDLETAHVRRFMLFLTSKQLIALNELREETVEYMALSPSPQRAGHVVTTLWHRSGNYTVIEIDPGGNCEYGKLG